MSPSNITKPQTFYLLIVLKKASKHPTHFRKRLYVKKGDLLAHAASSTDPPIHFLHTAGLPKDALHRPEVERCAPGTHR